MEVVIVIICTVFAAVLLALLIVKAVGLSKQVKAYRAAMAELEQSDSYLLDIVQNGKTVHIECTDVNSDNVELIAKEDAEAPAGTAAAADAASAPAQPAPAQTEEA